MDNQTDQQPIKKDALSVTIRNWGGVVTKEEAKAISSFNESGPFDILPEHANFISIIKDTLIIHKDQGQKNEMKIGRGILRTHSNQVEIYLEIVTKSE